MLTRIRYHLHTITYDPVKRTISQRKRRFLRNKTLWSNPVSGVYGMLPQIKMQYSILTFYDRADDVLNVVIAVSK